MKHRLCTYQLGSPRQRQEGLRIAAVRYLPRGVRKEDYARLNYFDIWLPNLAPSKELLRFFKESQKNGIDREKTWKQFKQRYEKEMIQTEKRQTIMLLAKVAEQTSISIGCHCPDEQYCHRSLLSNLIISHLSEAKR